MVVRVTITPVMVQQHTDLHATTLVTTEKLELTNDHSTQCVNKYLSSVLTISCVVNIPSPCYTFLLKHDYINVRILIILSTI